MGVPVELLNRCGVGLQSGRVVMIFPNNVRRELTGPEACELAAWLVAIAEGCDRSDFAAMRDDAGDFDPEKHFAAALEAIRNA